MVSILDSLTHSDQCRTLVRHCSCRIDRRIRISPQLLLHHPLSRRFCEPFVPSHCTVTPPFPPPVNYADGGLRTKIWRMDGSGTDHFLRLRRAAAIPQADGLLLGVQGRRHVACSITNRNISILFFFLMIRIRELFPHCEGQHFVATISAGVDPVPTPEIFYIRYYVPLSDPLYPASLTGPLLSIDFCSQIF